MSVGCRTQDGNLFSNRVQQPRCHRDKQNLIKKMQKKFKENVAARQSFRKQLELERSGKLESSVNKENSTAKAHTIEAHEECTETKPYQRPARTSVIKRFFGQITAKRRNTAKKINDAKELQLIWQKKDITRMRDSGIFQQMERMRTYAEAEPRFVVHKRSQLDCEQLDKLESNDRKLAQSQLTNLCAKAVRDIVESRTNIERKERNLQNELVDLNEISKEMRKLQKQQNKHSLLVTNCQESEESKCLNVLIVEKKTKQQPKALCAKDSVTELLYLRHIVEPENDFDQIETEKRALLETIENLMPTPQHKDVRKCANLPKKLRKQQQKTNEKRKKTEPHKKTKCLRVNFDKLNVAHTKKKLLNTQLTHMRASTERSLNAQDCACDKAKAKAKPNRANVKVPKSKCKHYRRENLCDKKKKKRPKPQPPSAQMYKFTRRAKKILNQTHECSQGEPMKILEKSAKLKIPSKPENSSCTVSRDSLKVDTATTSRAAAKVTHSVNGNKVQQTFSSYINALLSEPSTSSLEQMLVHIAAELEKRNTSKQNISKVFNACSAHKIVKKASKGAATRNKLKGGSKQPKPSAAIISIPLMQNPTFIPGQQNSHLPMVYTTRKRAFYVNSPPAIYLPDLRQRTKPLRVGSLVAQESEA